MFFTVIDKARELLESNQPQPLGKVEWTAPEIEKINELTPGCITTTPVVYLLNISKNSFILNIRMRGKVVLVGVRAGGARVMVISLID